MLEATRKRRTERIRIREICFRGPADKIVKLAELAKGLGVEDLSEKVGWRELFPEYSEESSPAVALRGARKREGLTQGDLSERAGIPQGHISEMENGRRAIGKETAKKLGRALNISYKIFL